MSFPNDEDFKSAETLTALERELLFPGANRGLNKLIKSLYDQKLPHSSFSPLLTEFMSLSGQLITKIFQSYDDGRRHSRHVMYCFWDPVKQEWTIAEEDE
jgi:hypothetical protein